VRILALDYGSARTGVAVSDATGTIAIPVGIVEQAATPEGLARLRDVVEDQEAERVVVGMPLTLRGELGEQARRTEEFVRALGELLDVPVEVYDERFTTKLAARDAERRGSNEDARAAAHLLESYLAWTSTSRR
jgi:putative Holliday junction resolvase